MKSVEIIFFGQNEYPWQVALLEQEAVSRRPHCGGTIISDDTILTAAQCVSGLNSL